MIAKTNYEATFVPVDDIIASPENDDLYNRVNQNRSDFKELVESIRAEGIKEPLHVTEDGFILSGHRRQAAAKAAGKSEVPVVIQPVRRSEMARARYRKLLASYNTQRDKTSGEKIREKLARSRPKAHQQIIAERLTHENEVQALSIQTCGHIKRHGISKAKQQFLDAILNDVESRRKDWPISVRSIHYNLIEKRPKVLRNSSKGKNRSTYENNRKSSSDLSDMATRARVSGLIPWGAIGDETRSQTVWDIHDTVEDYVAFAAKDFASRYQRDLLTGQTYHIELVIEKLTIHRPAKRAASRYTVPVTVARGKSSYPPRESVINRWRASGKPKLAVILFADLDPSGIEIVDMWHKSLIGDFGVSEDDLSVVRGGLNPEQAERFSLPQSIDAADQNFVDTYGSFQYELDALKSDQLETLVSEAIESVLDRKAYEEQVKKEEEDAGFLEQAAEEVAEFMAELVDNYRDE